MGRHSARVEPNANPTTGRAGPAILLAEDDPVSGRFLAAAMTALGCQVTWCTRTDAVVQRARGQCFDLLLFDRNLAGRDGIALLGQLRRANPRCRATPAVASSAEWTPAQRANALQAGFTATLDKPCSTTELRLALQQHVAADAWPVRHDHAATAAAGSAANLAALRKLFGNELRTWQRTLADLEAHPEQLRERLHRLCSSAGFCGAPALEAACRVRLAHLREDLASAAGRAEFEAALAAACREFARR